MANKGNIKTVYLFKQPIAHLCSLPPLHLSLLSIYIHLFHSRIIETANKKNFSFYTHRLVMFFCVYFVFAVCFTLRCLFYLLLLLLYFQSQGYFVLFCIFVHFFAFMNYISCALIRNLNRVFYCNR